MTRGQVIQKLQANSGELGEMGIRSLGLFGSLAREEGQSSSDVDLLAEFSRPVSLFDVVRIQDRIAAILNAPVDLMPLSCVPERKLQNIRKDLVHAFPQ